MMKGHRKSLSEVSEEIKKKQQQLGCISKVLKIKAVDNITVTRTIHQQT